jgi:hypothetical protein
MSVNGFLSRYWHSLLLLICSFVVIVAGQSCKTGGGVAGGGGGSSSPLLIITSVASSNLSATGATITWNTNKPANSEVEYGPTTNYGNVMSVKTMETSHSLTLVGLTGNTSYNFHVKSTDDAGNVSTSGNQTFKTMTGGSTPTPTPIPTPTPGPAPTPFPVVGVDEFVGPFPSWTNVKTAYNAKGDGTSDDTAAIQQALDALSNETGDVKTLYFPNGTYKITQKLRLHNTKYVNMIGEDPDYAIISWGGASGGIMLEIDGVAYSRFNRLQFDGKGSAKVAVDQAKRDGSANYFDTGNQYAEDVFRNVGYGIRAGIYDIGAAESSVVRCRFINNSIAGVATKNFNALDWWIWYSYFENCATGVTNAAEGQGAGNFSVYNSVFKNSSVADISIGQVQSASIRYNYSIGSKKFYNSMGAGVNGAMTAIQGNTILDTTDATSINLGDFGPINIYDNFIRSRGTSGPVINIAEAADVLAFDNTFTVAAANQINKNGRLISDGNKTGTISASEPVIPFKYVSANRPVFEVPKGSNTATIKQKIASAAGSCGQRPIVHFPASNTQFLISETLDIPANCDIQLVGDGGYSSLAWAGSGTGPVISLKGPSRATLRDLRVGGQSGDDVNGIVIENADQSNSRVYMQEVFVNISSEHGLIVDGLSSTRVDMRGFQHQDQHKDGDNTRSGSGIKIVGPTQDLGGRTILISGAASSNNYTYEVTGGRFVAKDVWYETSQSNDVPRAAYMKLSGNPTVTFDQAKVYTIPVNVTPPAIDIQNFGGAATFIGLDLEDRINISGSSAGQILGLGLQGHSSNYFLKDSNVTTDARLINSRWYDKTYGTRLVNNVGNADINVLRAMLAQTRGANLSNEYEKFPANITDVRMYRVYVERTIAGIQIKK